MFCLQACRSEEKAREAIENITFQLEAASKAIRHNQNIRVKGQVSYAPYSTIWLSFLFYAVVTLMPVIAFVTVPSASTA